MTGALLLLLLSQADAGTPPRGLTCLPTWYAGTVSYRADAGWGLQLETGVFVAWEARVERDGGTPDGGATRNAGALAGDPPTASVGGRDQPQRSGGWAAEKATRNPDPEGEDIPSLADIFEVPYVTGPIVPIDTSDAGPPVDPGRARVEDLFRATYGGKRTEVEPKLAKVRFFGLRYPFHERAAEPLRRVVERLEDAVKSDPKVLPFLKEIGGTFIWRNIKRSKALSSHAFGIAIDLNVERSDYWRWTYRGKPMIWKNRVPQAVVDAFEAEGFIWGGRWKHYDTMHFEYRPELLSPLCR